MDRANRMLDAAGDLLLAHGYRKVTVDDVARRAGVGKGTVYLHWPSKLELFAAVLVRDAVGITEDLLAAMRADPAEVLLHRSLRTTYLLVMRRPFARALYTGDQELVGAVATDSKIGLDLAARKAETTPELLRGLHRHGLLVDDPDTDRDLQFRLSASTVGFFLADRYLPAGGATLDHAADAEGAVLEAKADALATVVRRGFEPPGEADPAALAAVAPHVIDIHERLLTTLTTHLPEEEP